ncbi:MAG: HAMP domain-containing histidine kinase [Clostridia bacterium]|nr:HAMP domain-containing histidine kinase [Clostridia bacterium]
MVIIFSSLILLSLYFLLKSYVNKFAWCFAGMVCALEVCLLLILISMMKSGNYFAYYNGISQIDYMLFNFVDTMRLPQNIITRVFNYMIAVYMLLFPCFIYFFFSSSANYSKKAIVAFVAVATVAISSIVFYEPDMFLRYYIILINQNTALSVFLKYVIYTLDLFYYAVFALYAILPFVHFIRQRKVMNLIKRKQTIGVMLCSFLLNVFVFIIICSGMFRNIICINEPTALLFKSQNISQGQHLTMIIALASVVLIMFVVVNRLDVSRRIGFLEKMMCARSLHRVERNYIEIFHMFKNVLFSYDILIKKSMLCSEEEERTRHLSELDTKVNDYIAKLNKVLDINKSMDMFEKKIDVAQILDDALSLVSVPMENIEIVKEYTPGEISVLTDKFYLVEAVSNLIKNSVESIMQSEREGKIVIKAYSDFEWVVIEVEDNGIGFKIRNTRKIFKPLYTTKSRTNNWGIGLVHVSNIVKKHRGHIYAMNNKNKPGATMYIFLPRW